MRLAGRSTQTLAGIFYLERNWHSCCICLTGLAEGQRLLKKRGYPWRACCIGVSSELEGNNGIVHMDNRPNLRFADWGHGQQSVETHSFSPTIKLLVSSESERGLDRSEAEMFITKDAAAFLGFSKNLHKGVFSCRVRKLVVNPDTTSSGEH